jgi:DNA-binding LytR/AlgR family response regulator
MPYIDGFTLAHSIKPIPVILFTGDTERFRDILNIVEPIDVFSKPISKERLLKSVKNALLVLSQNKSPQEPVLLYTSEGAVNILLTDILFVKTIKNSHRYLEAYLKEGRKIVLKGYTLKHIHKVAGFLLQANRTELVAPAAIDKIERNFSIKLSCVNDNGKLLYSKVCLSFRKEFLASLSVISR